MAGGNGQGVFGNLGLDAVGVRAGTSGQGGITARASPEPSDELDRSISAAQTDINLAVGSPALRREPYRVILLALSGVLDVFRKSIVRWEGAVASVVAARDPLPAEDRAALVSELVAATEKGAYEAMRKEAARMVRTLDQGLVVRIGLVIGAAFAAGVLSTVGLFFFLAAGPYSKEAQIAAVWHQLERDNPDPRHALAAAETRLDRTVARHYHACVSLWAEPSPDPPAAPGSP